jgi:glycosyltransferase involved in cell wall biosynthesis
MWKENCLKCPDLARPMSVERDRAKFEVKRKEKILRKLDANFIVSTSWSKRLLIEKYPFLESRIRIIPFGIDQSKFFSKRDERNEVRKKLRISEHTIVILIRASTDPQKNLQFAKVAISALRDKDKFHVFTLEQPDHFSSPDVSNISSTDFGWITDEEKLADIYSAADVFLMPSTSETFGMMALEAMSCGTPVIYQRETAVDSVVDADERLTFRKNGSPKELTAILENLQSDPQVLVLESERVQRRALTEFSMEKYATNIASYYKDVIKS